MQPFSRKQLRQTLRQARRELHGTARIERETAILRAISQHPRLKRLRHLALYWPSDGEVDLRPLFNMGAAQQHYLPMLVRGSRLRFAVWTASSSLYPNRFGIPEPRVQPRKLLRPSQLDAVLMPLVGFDEFGNRLGMGGGFYDRSFAFRQARRRWRKPLLIGVAFELQRCPTLPAAAWDIPLDGIVTEHGLRLFQHV
jgi:5-formyltetrahydrofolate cyclo-ligase